MKRLILILAMVAGVLSLLWWQRAKIPFFKNIFHEEVANTKYTCPMHPQIIRDKPGKCPICGMTLVPMLESPSGHEHHHPDGSFLISPERRQLIGVQMAEITSKELQKELRLSGRVAFDKELYTTEQEYVSALQLGAGDLLKVMELKLKRLGISPEELQQLKKTRKVDTSLFLPEANKGFWVYASVYESDLLFVSPGMSATIQLPANPNISFEGIVRQVEPIVDPATRTAAARIWVSKNSENIKPETYLDVILKKDLGNVLAVPADAVIDTGARQIVFVDLGEGYIEPREVKLGALAGVDYSVVEGLQVGEKVVTSAHFLLDSESQIQAAVKQFGKSTIGHHHD